MTEAPARPVKCVVWDLDDTLWRGTLLEGDELRVPDVVRRTVLELDKRGILQSIASRNDPGVALAALRSHGMADYFVCPRVGWGEKADAIAEIAAELGLSMDTLLFVDDSPFERDAARFAHAALRCADAAEVTALLDRPDLRPRAATAEARARRALYMAENRRRDDEAAFTGPQVEFLRTLRMRLAVADAREEDLERAHELTARTSQLNATGRVYTVDELRAFLAPGRHRLVVATLDDRYGTYGRVGLVLLERQPELWTLRLLVVSCRVIARNVGFTLLAIVLRAARDAGVRLEAAFVPTAGNRPMRIAYRLGGFVERGAADGGIVLEHPLDRIPTVPDYIEVLTP